jgi:PEP-CTERM motif
MSHAGLAAITLAAMAATWTAGGARADTNIALGKTVSIVATDPDPNAGFNNGTAVNLQNVTNGVILPDATAYGSAAAVAQAIEWNGAGYVFQISLGGPYTVSGLIVDVDDNDAYQLQYYNASTSSWDALYTAPIVSVGFGLRTRPNVSDQSEEYILPSPVLTDAVRIYGGASDDNFCFDGSCGQGGYAVGQVELFGTPATGGVPEPSTWAMMLAGFAGLCSLGYRASRKSAAIAA